MKPEARPGDAQSPATVTRPGDEPTVVNPRSPKHQGVRTESDDVPSYSELRRRADADEDDLRAALPPGYVLHEYRIEKVLGVGGFGVTYLASDTVLGHQVAIKEYLPGELAARDGASGAIYPRSKRHGDDYGNGLTRFLLEARTLAGFHHHNIVGVHRFFEANNTAYMVMAYEQGESLNTWLSRRLLRGGGTPNEALLVEMFAPLLRGLDKVHQAGFLHRDIKPANIYVRDTDGSLVLLDFGAAREAGGIASAEGLTSIVTPGYAPFEQYHTHGRQGPWSDLYAVGGVLYWFVAGRRPIEAAARVQSDPQQPASEAGAGRYSEDFLAAIDWALTVDAHMRPQSVSEFLPALTGEMPVSRGGAAPPAEPPAPAGPLTIPPTFASLEKMGRQAAAVVLDAEPALVMGVEQPIESAAPRGPLAPRPDGPTTVTRAEQVTVITGGDDAARGTAGRLAWADWLRSPLLWCVLLCVLVLAGAGAVALRAGIAAPLSLGLHPGAVAQSAAETAEWVASLDPLSTLVREATGHPVRPEAFTDWSGEAAKGGEAGTEGSGHELYLATVDQVGGALERLHLTPLARFRDFRVNFLVRADASLNDPAQLKGKRLASYPAASAHGAIMMHWLTSSGLAAQDVQLRVSRKPEAMVDALLFGQVDVIALPQYATDEALARYPGKLKLFARSEAYPGLVLASGPQVPPKLARELGQVLQHAHETTAGMAALKAIRVRQSAGTTQLLPVGASDVASAAQRMERARALFPADAPPL